MRVGLAINYSAVILLHYASHSCRHLHVGMLVAGDLQGYVVTNRKSCEHEIASSSSMFHNHGVRMSFAARGHNSHMVFALLELPYSNNVLAV